MYATLSIWHAAVKEKKIGTVSKKNYCLYAILPMIILTCTSFAPKKKIWQQNI